MLPQWFSLAFRQAVVENEILSRNGAVSAVKARNALMQQFTDKYRQYAMEFLTVEEAASETGTCPETIRRAVRNGFLDGHQRTEGGRMKIQRWQLTETRQREAEATRKSPRGYDVETDSLNISLLKRSGHE